MLPPLHYYVSEGMPVARLLLSVLRLRFHGCHGIEDKLDFA